jgi:hypothetical protein
MTDTFCAGQRPRGYHHVFVNEPLNAPPYSSFCFQIHVLAFPLIFVQMCRVTVRIYVESTRTGENRNERRRRHVIVYNTIHTKDRLLLL